MGGLCDYPHKRCVERARSYSLSSIRPKTSSGHNVFTLDDSTGDRGRGSIHTAMLHGLLWLTNLGDLVRRVGMDVQFVVSSAGQLSRSQAKCHESAAWHMGADARSTAAGEQEAA